MNSANSVGSMLCLALDTFSNSFVNILFVGLGSVLDFSDNSLDKVNCVSCESVFFFSFLEGEWVIFYDNLPISPPES